MSFREFTTYNRWQKIFSLFFAILIWATIRQSVERGGGAPVVPDGYSRTFEHLPIRVLTPANEGEKFRITPSEVTIVLRGRPDLLNRLRPQDVDVYVSLPESPSTNSVRAVVRVNTPGGQLGSVSPEEVLIERLLPPDNRSRANP